MNEKIKGAITPNIFKRIILTKEEKDLHCGNFKMEKDIPYL